MLRSLLVVVLTLIAVPARAADSITADKRLNTALHNLYSLNYEEARASLRQIITTNPQDPFGYLFEAGAIWWQVSTEYDLFKSTPALEKLFEQDISDAITRSQPLIKSEDQGQKADGYFILGMAYGTRGQWHLMRGHWLKAYFEGRKGLDNLRKCVKIDAAYYDGYLGLGIYDYEAARFGRKINPLFGVFGSEKRGIAQMTTAMQKGRYTSHQAAIFLATLYIQDQHDYARALPLIQELRQDFPDSVYFESVEAFLQFELNAQKKSADMGRDVFEKLEGQPNELSRKLLSLACGLTGNKCLDRAETIELRDWLNQALQATLGSGPGPDPNLLKWRSTLHLFRGYTEDILGDSKTAEADYQWVLANPDYANWHARAQQCLEHRCTRATLLKYLESLAHQPGSGLK